MKPGRFDFVRIIAELEQPRKLAIKAAAILADGGGEHSMKSSLIKRSPHLLRIRPR